jgi:hypothetical protein
MFYNQIAEFSFVAFGIHALCFISSHAILDLIKES